MKTMNEIQTILDELFDGTIRGSTQIAQANTASRIVREKTRLYALRHKSAESQNKLDQLNEFYGIK